MSSPNSNMEHSLISEDVPLLDIILLSLPIQKHTERGLLCIVMFTQSLWALQMILKHFQLFLHYVLICCVVSAPHMM
jgi:hypothetical protein